MKTDKTLFLFVSCCREQSRYDILKQVVENLGCVDREISFKDDCIAFDNESTIDGSVELLVQKFKHVYRSDTNVGFWSALDWCINNYAKILNKDYEYVYVIESDLIHYAAHKLPAVERFLDENADVGHVRCEEFEYLNRHLYNKDFPVKDSRRYAWCKQFNAVSNSRIWFSEPILVQGTELRKMNFVAKVPAMNRLLFFKLALEDLKKAREFTEFDFQKAFYRYSQVSAFVEGGIFHSKLTNADSSMLSGSTAATTVLEHVGYVGTRTACLITAESRYQVRHLV